MLPTDDLFDERLNLMQMAASVDDRIEPKPFKAELFDLNDPWFMRLLKTASSSSKVGYEFLCLKPRATILSSVDT